MFTRRPSGRAFSSSISIRPAISRARCLLPLDRRTAGDERTRDWKPETERIGLSLFRVRQRAKAETVPAETRRSSHPPPVPKREPFLQKAVGT